MSEPVHYLKGIGFVIGWNGQSFKRSATFYEIGFALQTGNLYNTTNLKLINEEVK